MLFGQLRRREFTTLLCGAAVALPLAARAQQPAKLPRIGFLSPGAADSHSGAFKDALRQLRYVEGETIAIEWRFSGDRVERLPELAAGLVRLGVDLIVATSTAPANAARAATSTTPIVFVAVSDPVEFGFIKSLAQPGGNMTGLANLADPIWVENNCAGGNHYVLIRNETYFISADGYLMPTKKSQAPPDLRSFDPPQK
jgi:putative tryptophan/tyrosine transport system substrate-binding protein